MATVEELRFVPVKSLRAEDETVERLEVNHLGLFGDREYAFFEGDTHINTLYQRGHVAGPGHFLSQREDTQLTGVVPHLGDNGLWLTSDGQPDLWVPRAADIEENWRLGSVWGWEGLVVDQGDEASDWASTVVGRYTRLGALSIQNPRFSEDNPELGRVGFADGYPITIASVEAYDILNQQLIADGNDPIPRNRTRTTIILAGLEVPDLPEKAFPEDYISAIYIVSNGLTLVLRRIKACGRCPVPDTDQITGDRARSRPFLAALTKLGRHGNYTDQARYGKKPDVFFSQNFVIELPKDMTASDTIVIEKGASVEVEYEGETNWVSRSH